MNELNIDNESAAEEFCNDNNIETFKIEKESEKEFHTQHNKNFNKIRGGMSIEPTTMKVKPGMLTTSTEVYMIDKTKSQYKGMKNDSKNESNEKIIYDKKPGNAHACSSRQRTAEKLYDHIDHENIKNFQMKKSPSKRTVIMKSPSKRTVIMKSLSKRTVNEYENPLMNKMVFNENKSRLINDDKNSKCEIGIKINANPNGRHGDNMVNNNTHMHYNNNNSRKCVCYDTFCDCRAQSMSSDRLRIPIRKNECWINHTDLSLGHGSETHYHSKTIKRNALKSVLIRIT